MRIFARDADSGGRALCEPGEAIQETETYQRMRPLFLVCAVVHRRTSQGERSQEVHRQRRVAVQSEEASPIHDAIRRACFRLRLPAWPPETTTKSGAMWRAATRSASGRPGAMRPKWRSETWRTRRLMLARWGRGRIRPLGAFRIVAGCGVFSNAFFRERRFNRWSRAASTGMET